MYKIDKKLKKEYLLESTVTYITYFINEIRIGLSNNSDYKDIVVYGNFYIKIDEKEYSYKDIYPIKSDLGLLNLIDKKIIKVEVNNDKTILNITFDNGILIKFENDNMYETLHIRNKDGLSIFIM